MARSNPAAEQTEMDGLLQDVPSSPSPLSEKDDLIGQWEAEKWTRLADAICKFASSSIATEAKLSDERFNPALCAMRAWINMVMQTPPVMNQGNPYWLVMDRAITGALKELCLLHNDLLKHAGQLKPLNPSFGAHFVDLATRINEFIQGMK